MQHLLRLHPEFRCDAVDRVAVAISATKPGLLTLRYTVEGRIGALVLPAPAEPLRSDELWRHTCCEAFLREAEGEAYREFNFSPSTRWAAYRFDAYRAGMRPAAEIAAPEIAVETCDDTLVLGVALRVPELAAGARLGLSAVIEEAGGRKSYWALAHPPGKPDFHHSDCFALELPGALAP